MRRTQKCDTIIKNLSMLTKSITKPTRSSCTSVYAVAILQTFDKLLLESYI